MTLVTDVVTDMEVDPMDAPLDLVEMQSDDALLDTIASAPPSVDPWPVTDDFHDAPDGAVIEWPEFGPGLWHRSGDHWYSVQGSDAMLARILLAWRTDTASEPLPELVSTDSEWRS